MNNYSYSSVGYYQFAVDSYVYLSDNLHHLTTNYRFTQQFFEDIIAATRNNNPLIFIYIALLTVGWTMLRYVFTDYLIKVIHYKHSMNHDRPFLEYLANWQKVQAAGIGTRQTSRMCMELFLLFFIVASDGAHFDCESERSTFATARIDMEWYATAALN